MVNVNNNSPYEMGNGDGKMVTLGATELAALRGFVRDVLQTVALDDTGITLDLEEPALIAAEILKMHTPTGIIESD